MDEEPNDIFDRQHKEFIDALTLIASAIGTQTDFIENVCDSLDKIGSQFVTKQSDKPYLIKNTQAEILERIADALERIAELYQRRNDKEAE